MLPAVAHRRANNVYCLLLRKVPPVPKITECWRTQLRMPSVCPALWQKEKELTEVLLSVSHQLRVADQARGESLYTTLYVLQQRVSTSGGDVRQYG